MQIKDNSINPIGLQPELIFAIMSAQEVYNSHDYEMVITSLNDAQHSWTSLHYAGAAVDLRTVVLNPDEDWNIIAQEIKNKLNKHYDVINESNHIHIEFQPKR